MTIAIFLIYEHATASGDELAEWFCDAPLAALKNIGAVSCVEVYQPSTGDAAFFADGNGPSLMVQVDATDLDRANDILADDAFAATAVQGKYAAFVEVFETRHYPLKDQDQPDPRTAPLSFVVRYYRPVADQDGFIANYTAHHPALLAEFPAVRNVLCYLPVPFENPHGFERTDAFIGNEVVFDDLGALNRALKSDVLPILRDHSRDFSKFNYSTHFPMDRRQVHPSIRP